MLNAKSWIVKLRLENMAEKGQKCLFFLDEIVAFDAKKMVGNAKSPRWFCVFSPMVLYFLPEGFVKTPRGIFENTPPFTEKFPALHWKTPYRQLHHTLSSRKRHPIVVQYNPCWFIEKQPLSDYQLLTVITPLYCLISCPKYRSIQIRHSPC